MALGMSKYLKQKILNTFLRPETIWPWPGPFFSPDGLKNNWAQVETGESVTNAKFIEDYSSWDVLSLPPQDEDRIFQPKLVYVMLFGSDPGADWTYDQAYVQNTKPKILAQVRASHVRSGNNSDPLYIGNNSFGIWGDYLEVDKRSKDKPTKTSKLVDSPSAPSYITPDDPGYFVNSQGVIFPYPEPVFGQLYTDIYASNMVDLTFTDCPAAVITHVGIFDALSGGNMLFYGPLDQPVSTSLGQSLVIPARSIRVYCQNNDLEYDFANGEDALAMGSPTWYSDHLDETILRNGKASKGFDPQIWYLTDVSEGMSWEFQRRILGVTLGGGAEMNAAMAGSGTGLFPWSLGFHAGVFPQQQPGWAFKNGDQDIFTDVSGATAIDSTAVLNVEVRVPIVNYEQMPYWYIPSRTTFNPGGVVKNITLCTWVHADRFDLTFFSHQMKPMPLFQVNLSTPQRLDSADWLHIKPGDLAVQLK